jgi:hypothetical protein
MEHTQTLQEAAERAGGVEWVHEQLLPARPDVERADRDEVGVAHGAEHPRGGDRLIGTGGAGRTHEPEQRDGLPGAEAGAVQRAVRRLGDHLPGRLEDRGHRERLAAREPHQRLLPAGGVPARPARLVPVRPRAAVGGKHAPSAAAAAPADEVEDGQRDDHGEGREEDGVDECPAHFAEWLLLLDRKQVSSAGCREQWGGGMGSVLGCWGSSALAVLCSAFTLPLVLGNPFRWDGG